MAVKKNSYITAELAMADQQLAAYKKWLDDNPYDKIKDRKEMQKTKTGGSFLAVIQTEEAIRKGHRDTFKDYLSMCEVVDKLRTADEIKKKNARGSSDIPEAMEDD